MSKKKLKKRIKNLEKLYDTLCYKMNDYDVAIARFNKHTETPGEVKTISQTTMEEKEEEKPTFAQVLDEWLNGDKAEGDNV